MYTGITFAIFHESGTVPVEKEKLNKYNGSIISFWITLSSFGVILSGPDLLFLNFANEPLQKTSPSVKTAYD